MHTGVGNDTYFGENGYTERAKPMSGVSNTTVNDDLSVWRSSLDTISDKLIAMADVDGNGSKGLDGSELVLVVVKLAGKPSLGV